MSQNGKHQNKPKVVELVLDSGVRVYVRPLSPYTRQAVLKKLSDKFPYPDKKEYEEEIKDSESPGAIIKADDKNNSRYDEYRELIETADSERSRAYFETIVEMRVTFPDYKDRDALIAHFKAHIDDFSAFMDLGDDIWLNTLYHAICASQSDITEIMDVITETLDIMEPEPTDDDIHAAWRIFQPRISRAERSRFNQYAPLLQEIKKLQDKI